MGNTGAATQEEKFYHPLCGNPDLNPKLFTLFNMPGGEAQRAALSRVVSRRSAQSTEWTVTWTDRASP